MYTIQPYSITQAKKLGVDIKLSSNPKKKLDVFSKGKKIASIGAIGYRDYPTYINEKGIEYANERRRLYRIRHKSDVKSGNGYYANKILW